MPIFTVTVENSLSARPVATTEVFLRSQWADPWEDNEEPHLIPESVSLCLAPEMSKGIVTWRYGDVLRHGAAGYFHETEKFIRGKFIKIKWSVVPLGPGPPPAVVKEWIGIVYSEINQPLGPDSGGTTGTGRQKWSCFGIESLLNYCEMENATIETLDETPELSEAGARGPLVFNNNGWPNRSLDKHTLNAGPPIRESYVFSRGPDRTYWSTRDIVEYLIANHRPLGGTGAENIKWTIPSSDLDKIPNYDQPELDPFQRTIWKMLVELVTRYRLLSFYFTVNSFNQVEMRVCTFTESDITLPDGAVIPGNDQQLMFEFENSSDVEHVVKYENMHKVDQVVAWGDKRITIASFSDGAMTLLPSWTPAQQVIYESGGASDPAYPTELEDQMRFAMEFRSRDDLMDVFCRFKMSDDFTIDAFEDTGPLTYRPFWPEILPTTKLKIEGDYSSVIVDHDPFFGERPTFAVIKIPNETDKYCFLDQVSNQSYLETTDMDAPRNWGATIRADRDEPWSVRINVSGLPQHVLAGGGSGTDKFTATSPRDDEPQYGLWTWTQMYVTVAFQDERRIEAKYPETLPASVAQRKVKTLDMGDVYQQVWMLQDTVKDLKPDGTLDLQAYDLRVRDDLEKLKNVAAQAYSYYGIDRIAIEFVSGYGSEMWFVNLGNFVLDLDGSPINSIVSEIEMFFPVQESEVPEPVGNVTIKVTTSFGELDFEVFSERLKKRHYPDTPPVPSPSSTNFLGRMNQVTPMQYGPMPTLRDILGLR